MKLRSSGWVKLALRFDRSTGLNELKTLELVARELPDVDVQPYRRKLRNRRGVIDPPG